MGRPGGVISIGGRRALGRVFGKGLDLSLGSSCRVRVRGLGSGVLTFARRIRRTRGDMRRRRRLDRLGTGLKGAGHVLTTESHLGEIIVVTAAQTVRSAARIFCRLGARSDGSIGRDRARERNLSLNRFITSRCTFSSRAMAVARMAK